MITNEHYKCRSGAIVGQSALVGKVFREVWGTEGPGFESRQPDHETCRSAHGGAVRFTPSIAAPAENLLMDSAQEGGSWRLL